MSTDYPPPAVRDAADWLRGRGWQEREADRLSLTASAAALLRIAGAVERQDRRYSEFVSEGRADGR